MMPQKSTDDLYQELMSTSKLDAYIKNNQEQFSNQNVAELLTKLYENYPLTKAELARQSEMSEVYLHQVFSGRRKPSRDRLLCLCIGMKLSLEDSQHLLKCARYAQLYPKSRRDTIIIFGLLHGFSLYEVNDKLFAENEKTLC